MKFFPGNFSNRFYAVLLLMFMTSFVYAKTSSPLTVFFNSFDAKVTGSMVELKWEATEYNNRDFVVQHSSNGLDWENVGLVPSKRSTESLESYSFRYTNNVAGKHYYRLQHTDIDAKKTGNSRVITVTIITASEPAITIWPNPSTDQITIVNNTKSGIHYTVARLYDLSGKIILEKKLENGNNPIMVETLLTGTYIIKAESDMGTVFTQKIIKQ